MRSSISSSDSRLPRLAWGPVLGGALALAALFASTLELRLALRGFKPSVVDSEALWIAERERASALGSRALVLVGGSRIQLDADLDVLRRRTSLEPVQLAIDGTSFVPVFRELASDATITGTVVVDYYDHHLTAESDAPPPWQLAFERQRARAHVPDFAWTERRLGDALHNGLRSYADGARPLDALVSRLLPGQPTPQYLLTRPDRERLGDYSQLDMPSFYYARVIRHLGETPHVPEGATWQELDAALARLIEALQPRAEDFPRYDEMTTAIEAAAARIRARGGRVYFAALPTSGWVRAIDERRFPRARYWDRFAARIGVPAVHFADVPALQRMQCPDGSHLDYRDRARFTDALVDALGLARPAG